MLEGKDDEKGKTAGGETKKKQGYALSEEQKEDPFNFLGFGMVAYRDLMFSLILLFALLSLLMLPAMYFYKNGGAIQNIKKLEKYSLGNLGYSST